MKLQAIALGLALTVAGSAFAATVERTVTHVTPHGTVTRHIVTTNHRPMRHVVVREVHRHPRHVNRVVVVHPEHRHVSYNHRTVVVHRNS
jgi:hypothetical protein